MVMPVGMLPYEVALPSGAFLSLEKLFALPDCKYIQTFITHWMWDATIMKWWIEFCYGVCQIHIHVCHLQNSFLKVWCVKELLEFMSSILFVDFTKCVTWFRFAQFLNGYLGEATVAGFLHGLYTERS